MEKAFPAIITKAQFNRVGKLMRARAPKRSHPRRVGSTYLLSGLVKCRNCNRALTGQFAKSGKYAYYVCPSLVKLGKGACETPRLNARHFEEVVISCGTEVIARHRRSYKRDDFVFDPVHYLPLLERKTGALDQAAPLVGWDLPEEFGTLRRLLESRMGRRGKREFVAVLRLMETFSLDDVHVAVRDAIGLGALSFDAVKHLVLCGIQGRPPRLDLALYPCLPRVSVSTTSATDYMTLLSGRAS